MESNKVQPFIRAEGTAVVVSLPMRKLEIRLQKKFGTEGRANEISRALNVLLPMSIPFDDVDRTVEALKALDFK